MSDDIQGNGESVVTELPVTTSQGYSGKTVRFKCPKCDHIFLPSAKERQTRTGRSARAKGANFERLVAKKLQKWWNGENNEHGKYEFRRTPMSGGSALKVGFDLAGDIATNAPDFRYHLECKNAPAAFAGLHQLLTAPDGAIFKWWKQARADCPQHRTPVLIMNRPDQPTYCLGFGADFSVRMQTTAIRHVEFHHSGDRLLIWLLDDMLATSPELWK